MLKVKKFGPNDPIPVPARGYSTQERAEAQLKGILDYLGTVNPRDTFDAWVRLYTNGTCIVYWEKVEENEFGIISP